MAPGRDHRRRREPSPRARPRPRPPTRTRRCSTATSASTRSRKFLDDAANLRPTVDAYTNAGKSFGGIKLTPTAVAITGAAGSRHLRRLLRHDAAVHGTEGCHRIEGGHVDRRPAASSAASWHPHEPRARREWVIDVTFTDQSPRLRRRGAQADRTAAHAHTRRVRPQPRRDLHPGHVVDARRSGLPLRQRRALRTRRSRAAGDVALGARRAHEEHPSRRKSERARVVDGDAGRRSHGTTAGDARRVDSRRSRTRSAPRRRNGSWRHTRARRATSRSATSAGGDSHRTACGSSVATVA